jgi:hypothetical protein
MPLVRLPTAPLRRRIGRDAGAGERGLDAGDVDDPAAPARDHVARDGLAYVKDARDVRLKKPLEGVGREVLERRAVLHARVVHKDVDGFARCLEPVHCGPHAVMIRRIEGQHLGPGNPFGGSGQPRSVAPVQDHLRPRRREALSQREPDALRRPGDQRPPPRQIEKPVFHAAPPSDCTRQPPSPLLMLSLTSLSSRDPAPP